MLVHNTLQQLWEKTMSDVEKRIEPWRAGLRQTTLGMLGGMIQILGFIGLILLPLWLYTRYSCRRVNSPVRRFESSADSCGCGPRHWDVGILRRRQIAYYPCGANGRNGRLLCGLVHRRHRKPRRSCCGAHLVGRRYLLPCTCAADGKSKPSSRSSLHDRHRQGPVLPAG